MFSILPIYKKVGLISSIIGTIILLPYMTSIVSMMAGNEPRMEIGGVAYVGLFFALVSFLTGGIIQAARMAFGAAKVAFFIVPVPMAGFLVGAIAGYLIFVVLVCIPIIPMISSCRRCVC